jgi:hypothetical protein
VVHRHVAEEADLEGDDREGVGLDRRPDALEPADALAHRDDREVLEGDPEQPREVESTIHSPTMSPSVHPPPQWLTPSAVDHQSPRSRSRVK